MKSVMYATDRIYPEIKFTEGACAKLVKILRVFLKMALTQMVNITREETITLIDEAALDIINDKRRKEKRNNNLSVRQKLKADYQKKLS